MGIVNRFKQSWGGHDQKPLYYPLDPTWCYAVATWILLFPKTGLLTEKIVSEIHKLILVKELIKQTSFKFAISAIEVVIYASVSCAV